MGRHSAPPVSKKRLAPSFALGLALTGVGSIPYVQSSQPVTQELPVVKAPVKLVHSMHGGSTSRATASSIKSSSRVVNVAKKYVGRNLPYRMGGNSLKTGIDCSHFVHMVFKEAGHDYSYRSSSALARSVKRVKVPREGDLVLYHGHVGIYVGNGMMVHHGRSGGAFLVKVYKQNFIGYGRMAG